MSRAIIKRVRPKPGFEPNGPFYMAGYWYTEACSGVWKRWGDYVSPALYRMAADRALMAQAITSNYDARDGVEYSFTLSEPERRH